MHAFGVSKGLKNLYIPLVSTFDILLCPVVAGNQLFGRRDFDIVAGLVRRRTRRGRLGLIFFPDSLGFHLEFFEGFAVRELVEGWLVAGEVLVGDMLGLGCFEILEAETRWDRRWTCLLIVWVSVESAQKHTGQLIFAPRELRHGVGYPTGG